MTDPAARRRLIRRVQRLLNPPVRVLVRVGLVPGYALLETKGRRTGKRRRTVVGVHVEGDRAWVVSEHGSHAGYVRNLAADPLVRVNIRGRWQPARATVLPGDDAEARLRSFGRPIHAVVVRRSGTDLTTLRLDLGSPPPPGAKPTSAGAPPPTGETTPTMPDDEER